MNAGWIIVVVALCVFIVFIASLPDKPEDE